MLGTFNKLVIVQVPTFDVFLCIPSVNLSNERLVLQKPTYLRNKVLSVVKL